MNLQELQALLHKYYMGTSSSSDEDRLSDLLSSKDLPEEYIIEREMLTSFRTANEIPEPADGFENRIMEAIDENDRESGIIKLKRRIYSVTSVAAGILIILSTYFIFSRNDAPGDTFDDPMIAYAEAMSVLHEVSSKMNSGRVHISELAAFDKAVNNISLMSASSNTVTNELGTLKYLDKGFRVLVNKEEERD